jgi:dTDP-glucose 4,6-dehydratase
MDKYKSDEVLNVDCQTYAGDPKNLEGVDEVRYFSSPLSIWDKEELIQTFLNWRPHIVVHFAAESHVDNSIHGPRVFLETNIMGTHNMLEACRAYMAAEPSRLMRFHHVSTDEVFGHIPEGDNRKFNEESNYAPRSPYAASKAASDHLVRSFGNTYGIPFSISNCSNNYGPRQHDEKLIPTIIRKALAGEKIPIYGNGKNVRDWIFVDDHNKAIDLIVSRKECLGETYCIGADLEFSNIELAEAMCEILDSLNPKSDGSYKDQIAFVEDRKGHDFRYAIDSSKIERLGWQPFDDFGRMFENTVKWYIEKYEGK